MTNAISSSSGIITFIRKVMIVSAMLALVAFLGNGFNLIGWNLIVQIRYYILMGIFCIGASLLCFIQFRNHPIAFKYYTVFVTLWPFAIVLSSYLQGGSLTDDLLQIAPWTFVGAFFMIFYRFRFSEQMILWILSLYALITVGIQIAQQIDPLFAVFGGNPDDFSDLVVAEKRNGLARFFVGCISVQMLIMCFFWSKMLKTFRIHWGILSALMVVSIYLYLTKQVLISTLLTLGVSFFMV